jgi:hypothetical protein
MRALCAYACVALAACGGGVTEGTTAATKPDTTVTPPGTVQRTSLTVHVVPDPDDAGLLNRAGVAVAGITVRVQRLSGADTVRAAVTDASGTVRFDQLLDGVYQVSTDRVLTSTELARLELGERDASLLAGGLQAVVSPPTAREVSVALVASRRGSLVLSELYNVAPRYGSAYYTFADYREIANVSDTTIYLDGVLLFYDASPLHSTFPDENPCALNDALRLDTTAVWAGTIYRFPGSGREYPLTSGKAVVFAMDAIDHRAAVPELPDLSRAEFEELGTDGDVDNSFSANMIRLTRGSPAAVHGFNIPSGTYIGLALPIARDTLALTRTTLRRNTASNPAGLFRIPREAILDVAGFDLTPERFMSLGAYRSGLRNCAPWGGDVFERSPALLMDDTRNLAIRRKSLGRTTSGIELLQRTRTGARDFEVAQPLRRSLNR